MEEAKDALLAGLATSLCLCKFDGFGSREKALQLAIVASCLSPGLALHCADHRTSTIARHALHCTAAAAQVTLALALAAAACALPACQALSACVDGWLAA